MKTFKIHWFDLYRIALEAQLSCDKVYCDRAHSKEYRERQHELAIIAEQLKNWTGCETGIELEIREISGLD